MRAEEGRSSRVQSRSLLSLVLSVMINNDDGVALSKLLIPATTAHVLLLALVNTNVSTGVDDMVRGHGHDGLRQAGPVPGRPHVGDGVDEWAIPGTIAVIECR